MFRFGEPLYLYLLVVVPVLILLFFYSNFRRKKRLKAYGDPQLLIQLTSDYSRYRPDLKFWLSLSGVVLIIFMLARPQFGSSYEEVKRKGIETVVALDISNSMLAQDVTPSRLEKSKTLISRILEKSDNDKIAFIVFAGQAFTQMPITSDYVSAKMFLETIDPSFIVTQGTDIKGAIDLAMKSFTANEQVGRAIVLITDGESHEPGAVEAAKEASKKGIHIFVLGVGSPEGSPIPVRGTNQYRRDNQGNVIITKLNEQMGREIAQAGNGIYMRVDNTNAAEQILTTELDKLAKSDVNSKVYNEYDEQFNVVAWLAVVVLLIEILILNRKNPLFKNFKIFR